MLKIWQFSFLLILTASVVAQEIQINPYRLNQIAINNFVKDVNYLDLLQKGNTYLNTHEFDLAIQTYTKIINNNKLLTNTYWQRSQAYMKLGRIENGIVDLSKFIELEPSNALGYAQRGALYLANHDLIPAQSDLHKALILDNSKSTVHHDLGVVYSLLGDYKKAVKQFITAIALNPLSHQSFQNLAMAYYFMGNEQSALIVLKHAMKIKPNDRDLLLLKGNILQLLGQENEAQQLVEAAQQSKSVSVIRSRTTVDPEMMFRGIDGKLHILDEYFNQGKWIVLNIWGPKCPHCIEELPRLQDFYMEHKEFDATVVGIAVDYPSFGLARKEEVTRAIAVNRITYPILLGDASLASAVGNENLIGTPTTLFFSPQGKLVQVKVGQVTRELLDDFIENSSFD